MNDTEQRIAMAEALGWVCELANEHPQRFAWRSEDGTRFCLECDLPDYPNDLNAMHVAAMWLRENHPLKYIHYTAAITTLVAKFNSDLEDCYSISAHDATAHQRAEAFLKTIGKWKDETK